MATNTIKLFFSMAFTMFYFVLNAQTDSEYYPKVDAPFPDYYFEDIEHYKMNQVKVKDFRGKWLILDLWNRYCSVCLNKMPSLDSIQNNHGDDLQILLVGYTGSRYTKRSDNEQIRKLYEGFRIEKNLTLPIAYDSTLFHRMNIGACPYIIIINPEGIVRGITSSLNENELLKIMNGIDVPLVPAYRRDEIVR